MFKNKELLDKINEIDNQLNADDIRYNILGDKIVMRECIITQLVSLRKENQKLKAIVAELCDYVYSEKGEE